MKKSEDWNWSAETLKEIIRDISNRRDEYVKENDNSEYSKGVIDGYTFVLDSIKNELEGRGYDFRNWIDSSKD